MNSEIDLHCHTLASDGHFSPQDLVAKAAERGIKTLAITDHDTLDGFRAAREPAEKAAVTLISGIEISTVWNGMSVHIVGLNVDADSEAMKTAEAYQSQVRRQRAEVIADKLSRKLRHPIDLARVIEISGGNPDQVGRPHFAQYLVEAGLVSDTGTAFRKWLGAGKIGDVKSGWPSIAQAVEWIVDAGGVAVMAHAHLYKMTRTKLRRCIADFKAAGGQAIEVSYGQMDNNQRGQMAVIAKDFQLLGSCGSDFHGPNRFGLELGVMPPFPKDITPVWSLWQSDTQQQLG